MSLPPTRFAGIVYPGQFFYPGQYMGTFFRYNLRKIDFQR